MTVKQLVKALEKASNRNAQADTNGSLDAAIFTVDEDGGTCRAPGH